MSKLPANWVSSGIYSNVIEVGGNKNHAKFVFTKPPNTATDVEITIKEEILDINQKTIVGKSTKAFLGNIAGGKFVATKLRMGHKLSKHKNNEFRLTGPEEQNTIRGFVPDPERVASHILTLDVSHEVGGKRVQFNGTQQAHVHYPLAMVIPGGVATLDTTLNMIPKYAKHWKSKRPKYRHVEPTTMFVTKTLKKKIEPSYYNDIIRALTAAANAATAGVVALSVGHGSGVTSSSSMPFFNLVPEDNKSAVTGMKTKLRIREDDLIHWDKPPKPGAIKHMASHNTRVRLDALDRLGDALQATPIRRLLLHTCTAGLAKDFIQMLANRLRVPVMAQTDYIWTEPKASYYDKDKQATLPRDGEFWPIHRLGKVHYPRKEPPPRMGPP